MSAVPAEDKELSTKQQIYAAALRVDPDSADLKNITFPENGEIHIKFRSKDQLDRYKAHSENYKGGKYKDSASYDDDELTAKITKAAKENVDSKFADNVKNTKNKALWFAAYAGYKDAVEKLLTQRADVNYKHPAFGTALHAAAEYGHKEIVEHLLTKGANPATKHPNSNKTASELAAEAGDPEIAGIIKAKADSLKEEYKIQRQLYSLALTAKGEKHHVVKRNSDGSVVNPDGSISVTLRKKTSNAPEININKEKAEIEELDKYIKENKDLLLVEAILQDNLTATKALLTQGAGVEHDHQIHGTALQAAAIKSVPYFVEDILNKHPEISTKNLVKAFAVATKGPKALLTTRISENLSSAIANNKHEEVENILTAMKDTPELTKMLKAVDSNGDTFLHIAARSQNEPITKAFVAAGAPMGVKNHAGQTAKEIAMNGTSTQIQAAFTKKESQLNKDLLREVKNPRVTAGAVQSLLDKGADPNALDERAKGPEAGYRAMHYAAKSGKADVVKALVDRGGGSTTPSANFDLPLHLAARYGNKAMIEHMLPSQSIFIKDGLGRTPMDIAKAFGKGGDVIGDIDAAQKKLDAQLLTDIASPTKLQELLGLGANPSKALHEAVKANHEETVQALLKAGADPFSLDNDQKTALHYAKSVEISNLLLEGLSEDKRAELCAAKDKDGKTALHYAENRGQATIVLANNANINEKDNSGKTPLKAATEAKKEETAIYLLSKGASPEGIDVTPNSPVFKHMKANAALLQAAKEGKKDDIAQALINGANIETLGDKNQTALHIAAANGHVEVVHALIEAGANVLTRDSEKRTPINLAADVAAEAEKKSQDRLELDSTQHKQDPARKAKLLVEEELENTRSAKLRAEDIGKALYRPTQNAKLLLAAAEGREADVAKYLERLDRAPELDILKQALFSAAKKGHAATTKLLLQHSGSATTLERTTIANEALTRAISAGKHDVVAALASNPQIVKNEEWSRMLHAAINTDKPDIKMVKILLNNSSKSDLDRSVEGRTAAHIAAERGHKEILDDLATKGANLTVADNSGQHPMHLAAKAGKKDVLEFLIEHAPGSINEGGKYKKTPIHFAAESLIDSKEMIEKLHKAGADILKHDEFGQTPVYLADASHNSKAVAALVAKGADDPKTGRSILDQGILDTKSDLSKANKLFNEIFGTTGTPDLLLYAARSNKTDVALKLINGNYPLDRYGPEDGATALALAARNGNQRIVDAIIAKADPAKLGKIMNPGITAGGKQLPSPLHYAAMGGHQDIASTLVAKGANIEARDKEGLVALDHAIKHGHLTVAQTLFASSPTYAVDAALIANPEMRTALGLDPLGPSVAAPLATASLSATSSPPASPPVSALSATSVSSSDLATSVAQIPAPAEIDMEKLDKELRERVDKFLDKEKGKECWKHANTPDSDFSKSIKKESAELVKDLAQNGKLHDCPEGVHDKAKSEGDRKLYKLELDKLLEDREIARIWMPKFNKDGTNMVDEKGNQIMDLLVVGKNIDGKAAVIGGTITPPPERSSIENELIEQLKLVHGVRVATTLTVAPPAPPAPVAPTRAAPPAPLLAPEDTDDLPMKGNTAALVAALRSNSSTGGRGNESLSGGLGDVVSALGSAATFAATGATTDIKPPTLSAMKGTKPKPPGTRVTWDGK